LGIRGTRPSIILFQVFLSPIGATGKPGTDNQKSTLLPGILSLSKGRQKHSISQLHP
jgi:hypothetical protein